MLRIIEDSGDWFKCELLVEEGNSSTRIDVLLTEALKELASRDDAPEWFLVHQPNRNLVQNLIESGQLLKDGNVIKKSSLKLTPGSIVVANIVASSSREIEPDGSVPFEIVFEDEHLIVVDKPPGLVVHPGAGVKTGTLVNGLAFHLNSTNGPGEQGRPGIVHRLDKDTSGLLVVAKTQKAFSGLVEQFKDRRIKRTYNALVLTRPKGEGVINLPIARNPKRRTEMAVVDSGKHAITNWGVKEEYRNALLLELDLETGRTHQIRVHLRAMSSPILGDPIYGGSNSGLSGAELRAIAEFGRQALHAKNLRFEHPSTAKVVEFHSELPADFRILIEAFS